MHGIKSFQLGLNLYKVGMNSFHPFPTHCLVLIKTSLELLWVHLYEKFFLEQVAFIIFDFWRNFWSSTQQNYNLSRNGFIPEWNQFIPTRNQIIPTMNEFMGVQVFPYWLMTLIWDRVYFITYHKFVCNSIKKLIIPLATFLGRLFRWFG